MARSAGHIKSVQTGWLAAVGVALSLASCVLPPAQVDESTSNGGSPNGGSPNGGSPNGGSPNGGSSGSGGSSPCSECISTYCGSEASTCVANPECYALLDCSANCSDTACSNACYSAYPGGQADFDSYLQCAQIVCSSECGGG